MAKQRICLVVGYAQSVARGSGTAPNKIAVDPVDATKGVPVNPTTPRPNVRHQTMFGLPDVALGALTPAPGASSTSSMFSLLKEAIAAHTGWEVAIINRAQGNTGAVDAWCGWDAANGRIKKPGETGYDPGQLIDKLAGSVALATGNGFKVIMCTDGHNNDVAANRPVAQVIAASVHIQQRCKDAGASEVFVGRTARYIGGNYEAEFNPGGRIHQIADGVLAAIPGSFPGGDLSDLTDTALYSWDDQPFIHPNHAGVQVGAERWFKAFLKSGLI